MSPSCTPALSPRCLSTGNSPTSSGAPTGCLTVPYILRALLILSLLLLGVYLLPHPLLFPHNIFTTNPGIKEGPFVPINKFNVYTYHNVCLEEAVAPVNGSIRFINSVKYFQESLRVVVYNHNFTGRRKLSVAGSANSLINEWDVLYRQMDIPMEDSTYHSGQTAYFISTTCPGNLHHFWTDEFRPLHSMVAASNRLTSHTPNVLLYRTPWDLETGELECYDVKRYQDLLYLLNVDSHHDVFYKTPPNTCFENAVFGLGDFSDTIRDASDYVINKLGIDYDACPPNQVLIIQRNTRRIINIDLLVETTQQENFFNVKVITLETLPLLEQIREVACATILVGVQGAGLQWSVLMKPGSTLIEIAWPNKHWGFYFNNFIPPYNIYHRGVLAEKLRLNWTTYQSKVRSGRAVLAEERRRLEQEPPASVLDNVWKWADALVNVEHYRFAIRSHIFANMIKDH